MPKYRYGLKSHRLPAASLAFKLYGTLSLPSSVDLTPSMPAVYDQGELGSCTANALTAAVQFLNKGFQGSRLFLYYNERVLSGDVSTDDGSTIADGVQSLKTQGNVAESAWPYVIANFAVKPTASLYATALTNVVLAATNVSVNANQIKGCLANGSPVVIGIVVYSSFESTAALSSGIVPMPAASDTVLGGHAIVLVGYNDSTNLFKFRNSWGTSYGVQGYGYLPYAYVTDANLASDLWEITSVSPPPTPPTPAPSPIPASYTTCTCAIA